MPSVTLTKKLDRRVNRTRRQLSDALVSLSLERGYENLSVRDLTERADVGYATFFRHYPDKESLLRELFEETLNDLFTAVVPFAQAPERMLTILFSRLEQNAALYRMLLRTRHVTQLLDRVLEQGSQVFLSQETPRPGALVPPDIAAHHAIASSVTLIEWWLDHGMPYPAGRMGDILAVLVLRPVNEIAFLPRAAHG